MENQAAPEEGAVLDDERKVAGKRTYFTAVVVVFI
jgi:hypothetical protein